MADGMFVDLIPNFDQLERDLGDKDLKKEVSVEEDGGLLDGIMPDMGGQGGMFGGSGGMIAKLGALIGLVAVIVKAISSLPQIQAIMKMINTVIQLALLPFINMLFTFLKPILVDLIKLMPLWLSFWRNPVQNLIALVDFLGNQIMEAFMMLPSMILKGVKQAAEKPVEAAVGTVEFIRRRNPITNPFGFAPTLAGDVQRGIGWLLGEAQEDRNVSVNQNINVDGLSQEATVNKVAEGARTNPFGE